MRKWLVACGQAYTLSRFFFLVSCFCLSQSNVGQDWETGLRDTQMDGKMSFLGAIDALFTDVLPGTEKIHSAAVIFFCAGVFRVGVSVVDPATQAPMTGLLPMPSILIHVTGT
jgi:hypothetical protein